MTTDLNDYNLFLKFLDTYSPTGFIGINRADPLMVQLEQMMLENDQCLYIADAIHMKVLYTSLRSKDMFGLEPEDMNLYYFMEATHSDDIQRLNIGRTRLIKKAQDLFIDGSGSELLSTNFRIRNAAGSYSNILTQNYLYYTDVPYKTVFYLKIHTNIDWCKKMKCGYHYYLGNDMCFFRFPDDNMLSMGNVFTRREFEIIRLIAMGYSTEQIAEKLFLSPYTVNTHRGNILKKTGKTNVPELIYELQERGLL